MSLVGPSDWQVLLLATTRASPQITPRLRLGQNLEVEVECMAILDGKTMRLHC